MNRLGFATSVINSLNPMDRFRAKLKDWLSNVVYLRDLDASHMPVEIKKERKRLLRLAGGIIKKVKAAGVSVDGFQDSGLSFVPIVVGGVVAVALAAMAYWTNDFLKFKKKIDAYNQLRRDGVSSADAKEIVADFDRGKIDKAVRSLYKPVAIVGLGYVAYKVFGK